MDIKLKKDAKQKLLREMHLLSDTKLYPEAGQFMQTFLKEGDPISPTQINGLENVVAATHSIVAISDYIHHQHDKAAKHADPNRKNRDFYLARFYEILDQKLKEFAAFIEEHGAIFPIPADASKKDHREWVRLYEYYIMKEFVQHLVADHNYRAVNM